MEIKWDQTGEKTYELGVDHGVLYRHGADAVANPYSLAYAWNGLTQVSESPEGGEPQEQYADNIKYVVLMSKENFAGTINAFTYPDAFMECDGSIEAADGINITGQTRAQFGMSYRTKIGNDVDGENHGYKLHLVYGMRCQPSDKTRSTINESPEAVEFSWEFKTTPVGISTKKADDTEYEPTAHIVIDSTKFTTTAAKEKLKTLEAILYGTDGEQGQTGTEGRLPLPDEVISTLS